MTSEICAKCGHSKILHFKNGCTKTHDPDGEYYPCSCKKFEPQKKYLSTNLAEDGREYKEPQNNSPPKSLLDKEPEGDKVKAKATCPSGSDDFSETFDKEFCEGYNKLNHGSDDFSEKVNQWVEKNSETSKEDINYLKFHKDAIEELKKDMIEVNKLCSAIVKSEKFKPKDDESLSDKMEKVISSIETKMDNKLNTKDYCWLITKVTELWMLNKEAVKKLNDAIYNIKHRDSRWVRDCDLYDEINSIFGSELI